MAVWESPIFSGIRNKIGNNVVFSIWKGRPYFRSWVKPANPQTPKQQAGRDVMDKLVKRYQSIYGDIDVKAQWNEEGLAYLISGFNAFVKYGRKSLISVSPASGGAPLDVTVTYTLGISVAKAGLLQFDGTTWTIIKDAGELEEGVDKTVAVNGLAAGTYYFFIADMDVLKDGDSAPQAYQAITKWEPDLINGVAKEATTTAT